MVDLLIYTYEESIIYSPRSDQCLTGGMKGMNTPLPGTIMMTITMPFEILLLALTIFSVYKSTKALPLDSHPSSPIVRVVFHFNLSLKLISVPQMRLVVRDGIL